MESNLKYGKNSVNNENKEFFYKQRLELIQNTAIHSIINTNNINVKYFNQEKQVSPNNKNKLAPYNQVNEKNQVRESPIELLNDVEVIN